MYKPKLEKMDKKTIEARVETLKTSLNEAISDVVLTQANLKQFEGRVARLEGELNALVGVLGMIKETKEEKK